VAKQQKYCLLSNSRSTARTPPFALEHLHTLDAEHLLYHNPKPRSDSPRDLVLTPLGMIDKIAALIPFLITGHLFKLHSKFSWA
jgi:hypothetical protein